MRQDTNQILYQKKGVTISKLATDLLSRDVGDRITLISYYQEEFQVSRRTMQNIFNYLRDMGAVTLIHHGHQGTYIEALDYIKLQESCLQREITGIMSLPYPQTYEGLATAIYKQFKRLKFNVACTKGAVGRIQMMKSGTYQFAVVFQHAAEHVISCGGETECLMNFGTGSSLSKHTPLLRDKPAEGIMDGVKVAYDEDSLDQNKIIQNLTKNKKVRLVNLRTQQAISALLDGIIDVGVQNYDDMTENRRLDDLKIIFLVENEYNDLFPIVVMVIRKGNDYLAELLRRNISVEMTLKILGEVGEDIRQPYFQHFTVSASVNIKECRRRSSIYDVKYKEMHIEEENGMCRQRELTEGLKTLEESGMISSRVSAFCTDVVEITLGEKGDADGEELSMLITHLAMTGDRMEKKDDREMEISLEISEGVG